MTGAAKTAERESDEAIRLEAVDRLTEARRQKSVIEALIRECYFFAAPERMRAVLSTFKPPSAPPQDAEVLSQSFAFELCGDLPTVIMDTFLPQSENWVERKAGPFTPDGQKRDIERRAKQDDDKVFQAIAASNFYAECGKTFTPDLAIGNVAMWIERRRAGSYRCQGVPLRELEMNLGADGAIDDRFVVRWTKFRHLKKLMKGMAVPAKTQAYIARETERDCDADCCFVRGFWRDDEEDETERWRYVVLVDDHFVMASYVRGEGSCPLIVGRLGASTEWAWASGSMMKALPDFRTLDALSEKKILSIDMHLMPPTSYPDDGISHLEQGIEAGMVYPIRPGSETAIKNLYDPPPPDPAIYAMEDLKKGLKRLFWLDWPTQSGDTPPTATQWLDEMTMAQRRIGTPGMIFWAEFCAPVFLRFLFLMMADGLVERLKSGDGREVSLMPYNPAQRAAEQQDVAQFTRFVQVAGMAYPEEFKMWSDGKLTIDRLAGIMGVDHIWAMRSEDQIKSAVSNIAQLQGGAVPGAPDAAAGLAAQQAPQQDLAGADQPFGQFAFQSRNYGGNRS